MAAKAPAVQAKSAAPAAAGRRVMSHGDGARSGAQYARHGQGCAQGQPGSLRIGAMDDPREREAERIANLVGAAGAGVVGARGAGAPEFAPASVERTLAGPGRPLDATLKAEMEQHFGYDFSSVRVHADGAAEASADDIDADAYTVGRHVVFGAGRFAPATHAGRRLIAHELAHVVQDSARAHPAATPGIGRQHGRGLLALGPQAGATALYRAPKETDTASPQQGVSVLPSGVLLDQALIRVQEPAMTWLAVVDRSLDALWFQLVHDAAGSNDAREEQLRERAGRLNDVLRQVAPAVVSLRQLSEPQKYLPGVATAIVDEVEAVARMYAAAIVAAYGEKRSEEALLKSADARLLALPDFITQQYLSKKGVESELQKIHTAIFQIGELRSQAHRPAIARTSSDPNRPRLDDILQISFPAGKRAKLPFDTTLDRARRAKVKKDVETFTGVLLLQTEGYGNLAKAGLLYEQFAYWRYHLDQHPVLDRFPARKPTCDRYLTKLDDIIGDLECGWWSVLGLLTRYPAGASKLEQLFANAEFQQALKDIPARLNTIATINTVAIVVAITVGAALTAGVAAAGAAALAEAVGGGVIIVGGASLGAEALAFTAVSRMGQEIAFGKAEDSFKGNLLVNALALVVLKGTTWAYSRAFSILANPKAYKAAYALGKAGTGLAALQIFAEAHYAYVHKGKAMSGDERFRSIVESVIMMGALEAAGFITRPLQERIGADIAEALGLDKRFAADLAGLQKQQVALRTSFETLKRSASPEPKAIEGLLKEMQDLWGKELNMLKRGRDRHAISREQFDKAVASYEAAGARLQLQLANVDFVLPGGDAVAFRPIGNGVVVFDAGQEPALHDFYKEKGGKVETRPDGTMLGRLPSGDLTFYVPAREAPHIVANKEAIAIARDQAVHAAETDPVAAEGFKRLREKFGPRKLDTILAAASDVVALLRALADPGFAEMNNNFFYQELGASPAALDFVRARGADVFLNIYRHLPVSWKELGTPLKRAAELLDAAPTPEARKALREQFAGAPDAKALKALLGIPVAPPLAKPAGVTKKTMGVDRSAAKWKMYRAEAAKLAEQSNTVLTAEQLDLRADLEQIHDLARASKYAKFSHAARLAILVRFEKMAIDSGMLQGPANQKSGDLSEALFNPGYGKRKLYMLGGVAQKSNLTGVSILDYTIAHGGFTEWVEQKSDRIDQGTPQKDGALEAGVKAASKYLGHAKADLTNLPAGDKISLEFVRDPGPVTRQRMLDILFGPGSPVYRVRIGGGEWLEGKSVK